MKEKVTRRARKVKYLWLLKSLHGINVLPSLTHAFKHILCKIHFFLPYNSSLGYLDFMPSWSSIFERQRLHYLGLKKKGVTFIWKNKHQLACGPLTMALYCTKHSFCKFQELNRMGHVEKLILCFASSKFHVTIFVVWKIGGEFHVSNVSKLNEEKETEVGYVPYNCKYGY